jgi:hypothetical protein
MWYWLCDGSWVRGRRGWISESFAAVLDSWLVLHRGFLQRLSAIFALPLLLPPIRYTLPGSGADPRLSPNWSPGHSHLSAYGASQYRSRQRM